MKHLLLSAIAAISLVACKTKAVSETSNNQPTTATATSFTPKATLVNKFKRDFPNSTRAVWTKDATRTFVTFYSEGRYLSHAIYGYDGTLLENKLGVDPNKLPVTSKAFLNTKYPDHAIKNVYLIRNNNVPQKYLVELNGTDDAIFDLQGNFITYKP